ncbi:Mrp-4 [Aphelenchoides fujianensis]|nr:Mrp-4 [Aphelenchoides fujianensis]
MEAAESGLDWFCGERFWNPEILKSPTVPVLSKCIQHTVLSPLIIFQISIQRESTHPLPWTQLLSAKLTVTCILLLMVTFIFACQRYGKVTSGGMWLTWLLFVVCGLPELYYYLHLVMSPNRLVSREIPRFISFIVWYSCVVTQLILFSIADTPAQHRYKPPGAEATTTARSRRKNDVPTDRTERPKARIKKTPFHFFRLPKRGMVSRRRTSIGNRASKRRRHSTARESVVSTEASGRQLTGVERVETGRVKARVYLAYFQAMGFGLSLLFVLGMTTSTIASMVRNLWLTDWSNDNAKFAANSSYHERMPVGIRLGVYAAVGFAEVGLIFFGMSALLFGGSGGESAASRASSSIDSAGADAVSGRTDFFDITPFGRILNRCGKDIETIDFLLPFNVQFFASCILQVVSTLVIIMISTPIFGFVVFPLALMYLMGASTIRAYENVERFCRIAERKVDAHVQCRYLNYVANRWLSVRLEFIGQLRGALRRPLRGLDSASRRITFVLNFAVRQISKLETNIVSVERVNEYAEVESEAAWVVEGKRPPAGWPQKGAVEFRNYSTRYRSGLDLVVRGINARIEPGPARAGSSGGRGRARPVDGSILIDDVDIATIGLHDLRSLGTLRFNLDPFGQHTDEELWRSLELAHLKDFAAGMAEGLNVEITEGGANLSVGQRQLLCLARALLRHSTILVLDEATAIRRPEHGRTIRREFEGCTVLTIAHRLHTIADYDRVLVLDAGRVREFDSPRNLLQNPHSLYASMVQQAQGSASGVFR